MIVRFSAEQKMLGLSECQRLCSRNSREINDLAQRAGARIMPTAPFRVSVGTALNMLVLSAASNHGVELPTMAVHLPGLRCEALFNLGENYANWSFAGPYDAEQQFWPMLYGGRDTIRPRIAPLLEIPAGVTTRQLRYHSQSDVERLSPTQFEEELATRSSRFSIDAHTLAAQVRSICEGSLFTAKVAPTG